MEKEYIVIKKVVVDDDEKLGDYVDVIDNGVHYKYKREDFNNHFFECERGNILAESAVMMVSKDFKERFIAEYDQLNVRCQKLELMLNKWKDGKLEFIPNCNYGLLKLQLDHMIDYKSILGARAKIEDIEL